MEEPRAVDPAGVTFCKKPIDEAVCSVDPACGRVTLKPVSADSGEVAFFRSGSEATLLHVLDWMMLTGHFIRRLPNGFKRSSIMSLRPSSFTLSLTLPELLGTLQVFFLLAHPYNSDGTKGSALLRSAPYSSASRGAEPFVSRSPADQQSEFLLSLHIYLCEYLHLFFFFLTFMNSQPECLGIFAKTKEELIKKRKCVNFKIIEVVIWVKTRKCLCTQQSFALSSETDYYSSVEVVSALRGALHSEPAQTIGYFS